MPASPTAAWHELRAELRRVVGESTYEIWLEPLELLAVREGKLLLAAPPATRAWVAERFGRVLNRCATAAFGSDTQVEVSVHRSYLAGQPASHGATRFGQVEPGQEGALPGGGGWHSGQVALPGGGDWQSGREGRRSGRGGARYGEGPSRYGKGPSRYGVAPSTPSRHGATPSLQDGPELDLDAGALNPRYSFEQFIIGDGNQLAHAAALAVAERPGQTYNPLFLHGPPGLGKTHLLHAIGNYVKAFGGGASVRYTTVEAFTNQFIRALGSRSVDRFKQAYRDADVLLIDDVQFLASKAKTEEEFFHTFNALYETDRQLVLTCDRLPRQLVAVEERLRERFESGLVAVIRPPDFATRVAILRKRTVLDDVHIEDQAVLELIADRIADNVRTLEGALIRIVAYHSLTQLPIDVRLAEIVLDEMHPRQGPRPLSINAIQDAVAAYYDITTAELCSQSRAARVSWPRQVAIYLSRELTDASLQRIGEAFGGRNHATVLHACKRVETRAGDDQQTVDEVAELKQRLQREA